MTGSSDDPQGCLAAILRLFGINLGETSEPALSLPYRLRDDFLSAAEHTFYRVLVAAVGDQAVVCPKVNLADIFFVARPNENQAYRNKIDRKHVDFLLCHPATMKPLGGVELDDSSHQRANRRARDEFVDQVFAAAGLPIVHVVAKAGYNANVLASELKSCFDSAPESVAPAVVVQESGEPICPKCGVSMMQRTASKGANKGKQFWGCPNYPKCRQVVS